MVRSFLKTALRNLVGNKATGFINICGLSIGMTAAVFIFLWVQNEVTFNNYQPNNVYRIGYKWKDETNTLERSPLPIAGAATKGIPEVQRVALCQPNIYPVVFNINNKLFAEKTSAWVGSSWFNMFHYEFVQGNPVSFSQNPYSVILTESKAKKYFGEVTAMGQLIKIDTVNYLVAGVVKDNPVNSSLQFDILLPFESYIAPSQLQRKLHDWNNFNYLAFVQLQPNTSATATAAKFTSLVMGNLKGSEGVAVTFAPLRSLYFEENINTVLPHGNKKTTYIFAVLGLLLLITACINYVNLTTARASVRAKEVSVRKIVGAAKSHLFMQFIIESLMVSFISLLVTLFLMQLLLPVFNNITGQHFQLPLTSLPMWQILIGTLLFAALLNGVYPAMLLSSFKPLNVFRGKTILKMGDGAIRKGLVIFQFSLSILLIVGVLVIYGQLHYVQTTNPGYNLSQVAALEIPYKSYQHIKNEDRPAFFAAFKHEMQVQPGVTGVSAASEEVENIGNSAGAGNGDWAGKDTAYKASVARLGADEDFQKLFNIQLKEGRWFRTLKEDQHNYIINETAEAEFNIRKPVIGQRFIWGGDTGQLIGVVKDFHYRSLHDKIGPMVCLMDDNTNNNLFVKIAAGSVPKALSGMAAVWGKYIPNEPFAYNFLDDSFNNLYKTDIKTSQLILIFSLMAIVISALGLFGLATFTAEQRTKEIGIRKVLGASVQQITVLLSKEFVMLVLAAIIIATPVAWWAMSKWLEDFAYRITLNAWIFIAAGVLALVIALLSVSTQAIKTALANPVKSLRVE